MKTFIYTFLLLMPLFSTHQGIEGFLREAKGNQMGIEKSGRVKGAPMQAKLYIYKNLTQKELLGLEGNWCKSIQQKPYLIIQTDQKGYFKQSLKKGKYIVLVEAYDGFFIPYFDQFNQPGKCLVEPKKYTLLNILVNSKAIY